MRMREASWKERGDVFWASELHGDACSVVYVCGNPGIFAVRYGLGSGDRRAKNWGTHLPVSLGLEA